MIRTLLRGLRVAGDVKSVGKGRYHKRLLGRAVRRPINRKINRLFK